MPARTTGEIRYRGIAVDLDRDANMLAADPAFEPPPSARESPRYLIWVREGPLPRAEALALRAQGTRVLERLDGDAYLLALDLLPTRRAFPQTGRFLPLGWPFKLDPGLYGAPPGTVLRVTELPKDGPPVVSKPGSDGRIDVELLLHRDVGHGGPPLEDVLIPIAEKGDPSGRMRGDGLRFRARLASATLPSVARIEGVASIAPVRPATPSNDVARRIVALDGFKAAVMLRGAGEVVCVNEPGFDDGRVDDAGVHPAFADVDVRGQRSSRVIELVTTPCAGDLPRPEADDGGHATHVCGSVAGALDCGTTDGQGNATPLCGTAPASRLVVVNLHGDPQGKGKLDVPAELAGIWDRVHGQHGARVFTCSWNHPDDAAPLYGVHAAAADMFAWDHPAAVVLFSAGNEGTKPRFANGHATGQVELRSASVKDPGTSKNAICVGATESVRPEVRTQWWAVAGNFPDGSEARRIAEDPDRVAVFSGRGPSWKPTPEEQDAGPAPVGRAKPDLVAPGTAIASVQTRGLAFFNNQPTEPSTDVTPIRPPGTRGAYFLSGTSMATPLVAGCVALVREWLRTVRKLADPPASLVKALLVNGATPLGGRTPGEALPDDRPDEGSGFGRVDVEAVVNGGATCRTFEFHEDSFQDVDEERKVFSGKLDGAPNPAKRLKVTLAWTDAPGEALQSDLDLVVIVDGEERHGNLGKSPWFDRANTVEQVDWESPPPGTVEVLVRAHRLAPEILDGTRPPQPFHVVVRIE